MREKYSDLIYYKDDIIKEYSKKRKNLSYKEIEDLIRCFTLFLEEEFKKSDFNSYEIPNIGTLHKKVDFSKIKECNQNILDEDNLFISSAYLNTTSLPIVLKKDLLDKYYEGVTRQELQKTQNIK